MRTHEEAPRAPKARARAYMETGARTAEEGDHQEGEADAYEYPREVLREELEDEAGRP